MAILQVPRTIDEVNRLLDLSHRLSKVKSPKLNPLREQVFNLLNQSEVTNEEGSTPSEFGNFVTDHQIIRSLLRYLREGQQISSIITEESSVPKLLSDLEYLFTCILKEVTIDPIPLQLVKVNKSNPKDS